MAGLADRLRGKLKTALVRRAQPEVILFMKHLCRRPRTTNYHRPVYQSAMRPGRTLVLSPHPDDEVIGCGGALLAQREKGNPVTVVYLTRGESADPRTPSVEMTRLRRREAETLGRSQGWEQVFWGAEDGHLRSTPAYVAELERVLEAKRPTDIYLPSFFDPQTDHIAANRLLADTLRRRAFGDVAVWGCEVWAAVPGPNMIVDISRSFDRKIEMLAHYPSQLSLFNYGHLCRVRAGLNYLTYIGSEGMGAAEAFLRLPAAEYCRLGLEWMSQFHTDQDERYASAF